MVSVTDDSDAEDGDYTTLPTLPLSIPVTLADDRGSATGATSIVVTPATDADIDDETVILEVTVAGSNQSDEATVTIDDSDIGINTVTLTLNGGDAVSIDDNVGVTAVAVTVSVAFAAALPETQDPPQTVMVGVTDDSDAEDGDYTTLPALPLSIPVTLAENRESATGATSIVITPALDDDTDAEAVILEATIAGSMASDEATVTINDVGTPVAPPSPTTEGAVTSVEFSPAMVPFTEGMASTEMVTVTVHTDPGKTATHEVVLSSNTPLPLGTVASPISVMVAENAEMTSVGFSISYMPPEDDNSADETITITGTVGTVSGDLALNIADNDMGAVTSVEFSPDMLAVTEGAQFTGDGNRDGQCRNGSCW